MDIKQNIHQILKKKIICILFLRNKKKIEQKANCNYLYNMKMRKKICGKKIIFVEIKMDILKTDHNTHKILIEQN